MLGHQYPLEELVTIHMKQAKLSTSFVRRFFKLMGDWLRYRTKTPAVFLWVLESPPLNEEGRGGLHMHFLVHLPLPLRREFRNAAQGWVRLAGGEYKPGVFHSRRVGGAETGNLGLYLINLHNAVRYLMKAVDPSSAKRYGIEAKYQGHIPVKRLGYPCFYPYSLPR